MGRTQALVLESPGVPSWPHLHTGSAVLCMGQKQPCNFVGSKDTGTVAFFFLWVSLFKWVSSRSSISAVRVIITCAHLHVNITCAHLHVPEPLRNMRYEAGVRNQAV